MTRVVPYQNKPIQSKKSGSVRRNLSHKVILNCDREVLTKEIYHRVAAMLRVCGPQSSVSVYWSEVVERGISSSHNDHNCLYHFIQFTESEIGGGHLFWEVAEEHLTKAMMRKIKDLGFSGFDHAGPFIDQIPAHHDQKIIEISYTTAGIFFDIIGLPEPCNFEFDLIDQ